jgi:hypothetical protein
LSNGGKAVVMAVEKVTSWVVQHGVEATTTGISLDMMDMI